MVRYWVIAPYHDPRTTWPERALDQKGVEQAWLYDTKKDVIAIGWREVGDLVDSSEADIKRLCLNFWDKKKAGQYAGNLIRFWHCMNPGDRVIARKGRKTIIGLGTIKGTAYFSRQKAERMLPHDSLPNFIPVQLGTFRRI